MTDKVAPHTPRVPPIHEPAPYDVTDVYAIQACMEGRATPEQQKRAMEWIICKAASTYEADYRTDPRDHAFMSGRRFVGIQIRKMYVVNPVVLEKKTRS